MAELVWGDGQQTHSKEVPLTTTRPFGDFTFSDSAAAGDWTWARLAVRNVAGDGAFANPVWRGR
jgi:hypothetical protein